MKVAAMAKINNRNTCAPARRHCSKSALTGDLSMPSPPDRYLRPTAVAKFAEHNGNHTVDPVDRHSASPDAIMRTASGALPIGENNQPW